MILQGFREPRSWDRGPTDSPVESHSTIKNLIFKGGGDIYIYTRARVTNDRLIIYKGSIHVCSYGSTAVESRQL